MNPASTAAVPATLSPLAGGHAAASVNPGLIAGQPLAGAGPSVGGLSHWALALPEIVLAVLGLLILIYGVTRPKESATACTVLVLAALLVTAGLVIESPDGIAYGGLVVSDAFSRFAQVLILAGAALTTTLALDYNERQDIARFEFPLLVLFSTIGMLIMAQAASLMTLYMGLELQSLAIYVLCSFARDDVRSSEAGLKYFVLSALASGLLLYGISLCYGFSGTMQFGLIAQALAEPTGGATNVGLVIGIVFIVAGLAFKLSAVPFHMWTPDVYEGAPTPVTAFMSTAPKVAPFAVLLRAMIVPFGHVLHDWQQLIILVSICSMLLGSLAAIGQTSIKRLMAYSSIGHMGYALIGLAAGTEAGIRGTLIYLVTYVFMNAGTFACIIAMRRRGRALERIADLGGLAKTDPMLALTMAVLMFSMAGVPPMSGFFGKLFVFRAAVQSGLWTLAVIGVLTSVIGLYYYLRVVKVMYFDEAEDAFDTRAASLSFVATAGGLFTFLFFLVPAPVVQAAETAAQALFN